MSIAIAMQESTQTGTDTAEAADARTVTYQAIDPFPFCLTVAFFLSILIHVALLYGVAVHPQVGRASNAVVLNARITSADADLSARVDDLFLSPMRLPSPDIPKDLTKVSSAEGSQIDNTALPTEIPEPSALPQIEIPLLTDPTYYLPKQLDAIPKALSPIHPAYPEAALTKNIEGAVTMSLLIDESGLVDDAVVVKAQPVGYFEEKALEAFRNARFTPAQLRGRAVRSKVTLTVRFELNEAEKQ